MVTAYRHSLVGAVAALVFGAAVGAEPAQWLTPGGDGSGAYYSALTAINDANVGRLGFAWDHGLNTNRGLEATPIVVDGVMYTSGNWGRVYALDAATGRERWTYDPEVDGQWGRAACCDVVNRGVAVWQGRVYVASLDGYMHALDAATGRRLWRVDILPNRAAAHFRQASTGAPVIAGDVVVIGHGGADFKGARGSVAAFDLDSGALRWRFYTVPRDPKLGAQDQPHLARAIRTWDPRYDWSNGGGGTVWDGISYDPKLGLLYVGTANPAPYAIGRDAASGDQLYAASILAIRVKTGELAWYFQEVPGDGWDFDATAKMILTDLPVNGRPRPVLMQAAKNGYLYVLDRASGEVVSAWPFAAINWTRGLDPRTHRPQRTSLADYARQPRLVAPGMAGAHSWQPMAYSAATGLVYVPAIEGPMVYIETARRPLGEVDGMFTVLGLWSDQYVPGDLTSQLGPLPTLADLERVAGGGIQTQTRSVLRAVDPKSGRMVWERPGFDVWDGGVLATAGNLVFRGDVAGRLNVYAADSGRPLASVDVGTAIITAPMAYSVGDREYIAVMAGFGGANFSMPYPEGSAPKRFGNTGRIVAFALDGGAVPHPAEVAKLAPPAPPPREGSDASIARGGLLYARHCARCHAFGEAILPDLRYLSAPTHALFYDIVLGGVYRAKGMPRWDDVLTRSDAQAIHAYLVDEAWRAAR